MIKMRVLKVMDTLKLCVVDLEVELNGSLRHAPTLCAMDGQYVIPLNTQDVRPRIQLASATCWLCPMNS